MDNECEWRLCVQRSTAIEEWGIEVDLSSPYALSSGLSTITLELDGQRDVTQADMLLSSFFVFSLCIPATHCVIRLITATASASAMGLVGYQ